MILKGLKIGFAITGSFCTVEECIPYIVELVNQGANVMPILSDIVATTNTRFTKCIELTNRLEYLTGNEVMQTIQQCEPIGAKNLLDVLIVAPCTGNTLAKVANAITDTSVTMAIKATLRNNNPVVLAISTNDGLGANAKNIGLLMDTKNIYLVPFYQDNAIVKSKSLLSKFELIIETTMMALDKTQIQPILFSN